MQFKLFQAFLIQSRYMKFKTMWKKKTDKTLKGEKKTKPLLAFAGCTPKFEQSSRKLMRKKEIINLQCETSAINTLPIS